MKAVVCPTTDASRQTAEYIQVSESAAEQRSASDELAVQSDTLAVSRLNDAAKRNDKSLVRLQGTDIYVPIPRKTPMKELEEDEYITALSTIIERDFFPSLKKMRTQNEFLTAVEQVDLVKARQLGKMLARDETPLRMSCIYTHNHPAGMHAMNNTDTPIVNQDTTTENDTRQDAYSTDMSLDTFQSTYTSEDNASFQCIMDQSALARKAKYAWVYNQEVNRHSLTNPQSLISNGDMIVNPHGFIEGWNYIVLNLKVY